LPEASEPVEELHIKQEPLPTRWEGLEWTGQVQVLEVVAFRDFGARGGQGPEDTDNQSYHPNPAEGCRAIRSEPTDPFGGCVFHDVSPQR
jgi:hypothetical protein